MAHNTPFSNKSTPFSITKNRLARLLKDTPGAVSTHEFPDFSQPMPASSPVSSIEEGRGLRSHSSFQITNLGPESPPETDSDLSDIQGISKQKGDWRKSVLNSANRPSVKDLLKNMDQAQSENYNGAIKNRPRLLRSAKKTLDRSWVIPENIELESVFSDSGAAGLHPFTKKNSLLSKHVKLDSIPIPDSEQAIVDSLKKLKEQLRDSQAKVTKLQSDLLRKKDEVAALKRQSQKDREKYDSLQNERKALEASQTSRADQMRMMRLEADTNRYKSELKNAENELKIASERAKEMESKLAVMQQKAENKDQEISTLRTQVESLTLELNQKDKKLKDMDKSKEPRNKKTKLTERHTLLRDEETGTESSSQTESDDIEDKLSSKESNNDEDNNSSKLVEKMRVQIRKLKAEVAELKSNRNAHIELTRQPLRLINDNKINASHSIDPKLKKRFEEMDRWFNMRLSQDERKQKYDLTAECEQNWLSTPGKPQSISWHSQRDRVFSSPEAFNVDPVPRRAFQYRVPEDSRCKICNEGNENVGKSHIHASEDFENLNEFNDSIARPSRSVKEAVFSLRKNIQEEFFRLQNAYKDAENEFQRLPLGYHKGRRNELVNSMEILMRDLKLKADELYDLQDICMWGVSKVDPITP